MQLHRYLVIHQLHKMAIKVLELYYLLGVTVINW